MRRAVFVAHEKIHKEPLHGLKIACKHHARKARSKLKESEPTRKREPLLGKRDMATSQTEMPPPASSPIKLMVVVFRCPCRYQYEDITKAGAQTQTGSYLKQNVFP